MSIKVTIVDDAACEGLIPEICGRSHTTFVEDCPNGLYAFVPGENALHLPDVECEPEMHTTLYADGYLIINELGEDRDANIELHGSVVAEYKPYTIDDPYDFRVGFGNEYIDGKSVMSLDIVEPIWGEHLQDIIFVQFGSLVRPKNVDGWFAGTNIVGIDFTNFDGSICESANATLAFCTHLYPNINIPVSFPVLRYCTCMFQNCTSIESLNLCNLNTDSIHTCTSMFLRCSSLKTIYSHAIEEAEWNQNLFYKCESLIGENGTAYDANYVDATYARPDAVGTPGYFHNC